MKTDEGIQSRHERLMKLLEVASAIPFKVWRLSRPLKVIAAVLALLIGAALVWAWLEFSNTVVLTIGDIGWAVVAVIVGVVLGSTAKKFLQWSQTVTRIAVALGMGLFGWVAAQAHLRIFDPLFLRLGRLSALPEGPQEAAKSASKTS